MMLFLCVVLVCVCACVRACLCARMICMHDLYVCMYVCACVCIYIYIYIYIYYIYAYTYIHTYTLACSQKYKTFGACMPTFGATETLFSRGDTSQQVFLMSTSCAAVRRGLSASRLS